MLSPWCCNGLFVSLDSPRQAMYACLGFVFSLACASNVNAAQPHRTAHHSNVMPQRKSSAASFSTGVCAFVRTAQKLDSLVSLMNTYFPLELLSRVLGCRSHKAPTESPQYPSHPPALQSCELYYMIAARCDLPRFLHSNFAGHAFASWAPCW